MVVNTVCTNRLCDVEMAIKNLDGLMDTATDKDDLKKVTTDDDNSSTKNKRRRYVNCNSKEDDIHGVNNAKMNELVDAGEAKDITVNMNLCPFWHPSTHRQAPAEKKLFDTFMCRYWMSYNVLDSTSSIIETSNTSCDGGLE